MVYPYILTSRVDVLPISLSYAKTYVHVDAVNTSQDATITRMLKAARDYFEEQTNRLTTTATFTTYRDSFNSDRCFEIRKVPLQSIESVKYYDEDDNIQTIDSSNYFITPYVGYSFLTFKSDFDLPGLTSENRWPIEISFKAGYSDNEDEIPQGIEDGLLAHLAKLFANRGDAYEFSNDTAKVGSNRTVPRTTKLAIRTYKVEEIGA